MLTTGDIIPVNILTTPSIPRCTRERVIINYYNESTIDIVYIFCRMQVTNNPQWEGDCLIIILWISCSVNNYDSLFVDGFSSGFSYRYRVNTSLGTHFICWNIVDLLISCRDILQFGEVNCLAAIISSVGFVHLHILIISDFRESIASTRRSSFSCAVSSFGFLLRLISAIFHWFFALIEAITLSSTSWPSSS